MGGEWGLTEEGAARLVRFWKNFIILHSASSKQKINGLIPVLLDRDIRAGQSGWVSLQMQFCNKFV